MQKPGMNLPAASGRGILTELIFHSPQVAGNLPIEIKIVPNQFRSVSRAPPEVFVNKMDNLSNYITVI